MDPTGLCKWCGQKIKVVCSHMDCGKAYARGFDTKGCEEAYDKEKELVLKWEQRRFANAS